MIMMMNVAELYNIFRNSSESPKGELCVDYSERLQCFFLYCSTSVQLYSLFCPSRMTSLLPFTHSLSLSLSFYFHTSCTLSYQEYMNPRGPPHRLFFPSLTHSHSTLLSHTHTLTSTHSPVKSQLVWQKKIKNHSVFLEHQRKQRRLDHLQIWRSPRLLSSATTKRTWTDLLMKHGPLVSLC